jgi:hypothetical protein
VLVARLAGGLGNQLFIYAAGQALAAATGREFLIDTTSGFDRDIYERRFELHHFAITARPYKGWLSLGGWRGRVLRAAARQHSRFLSNEKKYWFPEGQPEKVLDALRRTDDARVVLEGYFQNARFFEQSRNVLRGELRLISTSLSRDVSSLLRQAEAEHVVAVHIRGNRGLSASGKVVGAKNHLGKAYYSRAVRHALSEDPAAEFLIFSDGASPSDYLPLDHMRVLNDSLARHSDIVDFTAMRRCRSQIIANSTFSWWAAWLKEAPTGFVVSPRAEEFGFPISIPKCWHIP